MTEVGAFSIGPVPAFPRAPYRLHSFQVSFAVFCVCFVEHPRLILVSGRDNPGEFFVPENLRTCIGGEMSYM